MVVVYSPSIKVFYFFPILFSILFSLELFCVLFILLFSFSIFFLNTRRYATQFLFAPKKFNHSAHVRPGKEKEKEEEDKKFYYV